MTGSVPKCAVWGLFLATLFLVPGAALSASTRPGVIRVEVDETRAPQRILHTHLTIPVQPGPLVLYYPQWIPGEHMPDGPINNIAGLKFVAGRKAVPWRRDLLDMFEFHLEIPPGVTTLDVSFDFLISGGGSGYSSGASSTASINNLSWNQVLLYPQGYASKDLTYLPSLTLPAGWKFGTALPGAKQDGDTINFAPVSLSTLIDSPVLTGRYFRVIQLTPDQTPTHEIDIAADSAAALEMPPETEAHYRQLIAETGALFGVRHYRDYHFLLTLSDYVAHFGLEHHESSDDRIYEKSVTDQAYRTETADLLPHEFVHSWNGKYRRPADLATTDYHQPMRDDLLWVYEGLTEYWGEVLTARSGLLSQEQEHEAMARLAAFFDHEPGRNWRPLQDTADSAVVLYQADDDWTNWRRQVDFYEEGEFLWLDVDTTLRRLTKDKKSLNDFCLSFYGGPGGEPVLKPYTFEDVVAGLNGVAPYDWSTFLRNRLDSVAPKTPQEALLNSGWQLTYSDQPNEIETVRDAVRKRLTLMNSVGLTASDEGIIEEVLYDGPSYRAGLGPGMKITQVGGKPFSLGALKDAVAASAASPVQLTVANGNEVQAVSIDYHNGLKYSHLQRVANRPDVLDQILHPLAP
jgi:predicted metalloprotease with PDZ domain